MARRPQAAQPQVPEGFELVLCCATFTITHRGGEGMIRGCVIGESLRVGARFAPANIRIDKVTRLDVSGSARGDQPATWTAIDFVGEDEDADEIAGALADSLAPTGG